MSPNDEREQNRIRSTLSLARENLHSGYHGAAAAALEQLLDDGVAEAQSLLGLLYAQGKGVARDFKASLELFQKAAAQGDADGQYYLGYAYLEGSGVKADPVTALAWFMQAAARGHEKATLERDKGLASLDEAARLQADYRSRDFGLPMPAGWLHDPQSGTAFWSPSYYRNGTYRVEIEAPAVEGYAHGEGKVRLTASLPGDSDRVLDGVFQNGYLFDDDPPDFPFEMLESDDYLLDLSARLPADGPANTLWLRRNLVGGQISLRLGVAASPDLLVVVNDDFPAHEESAVAELARTAVSLFMEIRPLDDNAFATVTTLPIDHWRVFDDGELKFEPRQAEITLSDFFEEPAAWSVTVRNKSAEIEAKRLALEQERRQEAEREARRLEQEQAALGRGMPDIRGAKLGLSLAELHALFEADIETWEPRYDPNL